MLRRNRYKDLGVAQRLFVLVSACFLLVLGLQSFAANTETFLAEGKHEAVIKPEYYPDYTLTMDLERIRDQDESLVWQDVLEDYANFGYVPYPVWYRFDISNLGDTYRQHVLEISYPLLDEVDYYRFDASGQLLEALETGDRRPYDSRMVDHPHFLFPLQMAPGEKHTIYLRVWTSGSQLVPLTLWDDIALFSALAEESEMHAVYFGIVLVIVFLNTLIFFALGEKMYLYYAASAFSFMLLFAALRGKLYAVVQSSNPEFHHALFLFLPSACLIFSALFTREFLNVSKYSATLSTMINLVIFIQLTCVAGVFLFDRQTSLQFSVMSAIPCSFLLLVFGPVLSWMGNGIAWVYTLAWGTLMSGATITALSKQGFIASSFVTEYGMQIGSAIEIFILTAALVYRFYIEHKSRIAAQEESLREGAERRDAELRLLDSSMTHPVTMMPNRTCFEQTINQCIKQSRTPLMIVTIENRRFAEVCKTLGQQNADLMLCDLARSYNEQLSNIGSVKTISAPSFTAYVCSLEGGSFGLILDQTQVDQHQSDIRELIRQVLKPVDYKGMVLDLQAAIGVALYPEHGVNASTLIRHSEVAADFADPSMQAVSYYRPEHDQYNARRLTMISDLKGAIAENQLSLYLQPKLDLKSGYVAGVEALIRWQHEKYGMIRPDEFIPMAEQTGIIRKLTRWVFDRALYQQVVLDKAGYALDVSVNISAVNLREPDLIDYFDSKLKEYGTDPSRVYLELTETSVMEDPNRALYTLRKLRGIGLKISVDDFGTGYSSLSYLKDLPAHEIKIDKSLVQGLGSSQRHDAVTRTAIGMCHDLGFGVVAEGVESQVVMDGLEALGCDMIQGYHLTPPLPLEELIEWINGSGFSVVNAS